MKYFNLKELTSSSTANSRGIDNTPDEVLISNLNKLVNNLLDPLRKLYGKPIYVTSGYRCPILNALVGGASTSHHLKGMAADIDTYNDNNNKKLFEILLKSDLKWTQAILEKGGSWIHLSYDESDLKNLVLYT